MGMLGTAAGALEAARRGCAPRPSRAAFAAGFGAAGAARVVALRDRVALGIHRHPAVRLDGSLPVRLARERGGGHVLRARTPAWPPGSREARRRPAGRCENEAEEGDGKSGCSHGAKSIPTLRPGKGQPARPERVRPGAPGRLVKESPHGGWSGCNRPRPRGRGVAAVPRGDAEERALPRLSPVSPRGLVPADPARGAPRRLRDGAHEAGPPPREHDREHRAARQRVRAARRARSPR